jgi:uncharacterized protein YqjF (DUF2071 family)
MITTPSLEERLAVRERPPGIPVMQHTWQDLLFVHWAFDPSLIQSTLPEGLYIDTFEGKAFVGIVPFFMRDVRLRSLPPIPLVSNFLELNVRTYASDREGTPGVWFYSLDANQYLAVKAARFSFGLPYYHAWMAAEKDPNTKEIRYYSRRNRRNPPPGCFFHYGGVGPVRRAEPGTLEFFLIERYVLFSKIAGKIYKGRVHHQPYPVQDACVHAWDDGLLEPDGLERPARPPDVAHYSAGVQVQVFPLAR